MSAASKGLNGPDRRKHFSRQVAVGAKAGTCVLARQGREGAGVIPEDYARLSFPDGALLYVGIIWHCTLGWYLHCVALHCTVFYFTSVLWW